MKKQASVLLPLSALPGQAEVKIVFGKSELIKKLLTVIALLFALFAKAQIGIGTTSPNSTLDVRGSLSNAVTTFTGTTTAGSSDNLLLFTGTSATTLTLPTAVGITGREYWVKNASSNSSTLTIATTSSQTIDGLSSWTLTLTNKAIRLVSDGTNWYAATESLPGSTGTPWTLGGNNVSSLQNIGTTSNYALPFLTNNTERMRVSATGNLGIGTSSFDGTNPEKFLVDAGTTTSVNAIVGKGTINSYLQLNIKNGSSGTAASSDVVATANNGSETTNYVDMGINGSGNTSGVMGGADDAYLYNIGQNLLVGTGTAAKSLVFMTGGTTQSTNERLRIDGNGKVGLGINTIPKGSIGVAKFAIEGTNSSSSGPHMQFTTSTDNYPLMQILPWTHDAVYNPYDAYYDGSGWRSSTTAGGNFVLAKEGGKFLWYYAAINTQGSAITWSPGVALNNSGKVGIGTSTFDATNPEKLLVDAGTTTSVNAIVGKGTINSYLQLNIKNGSSGTAASSDVVATANNGSETTNYVDMGINGGGNTSGVMGGADDAYLYNIGQNLLVGTGTAAKSLVFMTGGTTQSTNERMRINGSGSVGIGTTTFNGTYPERLIVDAGSTGNTNYQNVIIGKGNTNSYAQLNIQNGSTGTAASSDVVATANNGSETTHFIDMGINGGGNTSTGILGGANTAYIYGTGNDMSIGNATSAKDLILFTGGTATTNERLRATANGLTMTGSHAVSYRSGTGNYTLLTTDYVVIHTGSAATWTLPAASGCAGRVYRLLNHGTGNITLSIAVYTANATTSTTLAFAASTNFYEIVSDGTSWRAIN